MKSLFWAALSGAVLLAGCQDRDAANAPPPPPVELTASAVGHYCGMRVVEHSGPKGQIILASRKEPVWFSSARDAFSFTMLPEEAKDIRAIYVSDMAKAPKCSPEMSWQQQQQQHMKMVSGSGGTGGGSGGARSGM